MRVLDIKRIYSASKTNCDFVLVLKVISNNRVIFTLIVIIKGQQIIYQHLNNTCISSNYPLHRWCGCNCSPYTTSKNIT